MKNISSAFLLFAALFTGVYFFTACDDSESNKLNTEYTINAVNIAIKEATKNHHPSDINISQFVKYEDNYQIELTEPKISGVFENEVLDIIEYDTQYLITLKAINTKFDEDGVATTEINEQKVILAKGPSYQASSIQNTYQGLPISTLISNGFSLQNNSELKIFNLKIESVSVPYPNSVQMKMGCDLSQPCLFKGTRIRFLAHEYINKTKPIEFAVDRIYMTNGSYLNGTFSSCISRFFDAPERDYYIKQCSVLRDYGNR